MVGGLDYIAVGERLRGYRRQAQLTQKDLAGSVGITPSFVGQLERGEKVPSLETVAGLCDCLGISLDALVLGRRETRCDRQDCPMYRHMKRVLEQY